MLLSAAVGRVSAQRAALPRSTLGQAAEGAVTGVHCCCAGPVSADPLVATLLLNASLARLLQHCRRTATGLVLGHSSGAGGAESDAGGRVNVINARHVVACEGVALTFVIRAAFAAGAAAHCRKLPAAPPSLPAPARRLQT